jgi:hypothetical protein
LTPQVQSVLTGAKIQSNTITTTSNNIKNTTKIPNIASLNSISSLSKVSQVNLNASAIIKMQPTFYVRVIPMKNGKVI